MGQAYILLDSVQKIPALTGNMDEAFQIQLYGPMALQIWVKNTLNNGYGTLIEYTLQFNTDGVWA
jgi:hypothetical protein